MDGGNRGPGAWLLTGLHHPAAYQALLKWSVRAWQGARTAGVRRAWKELTVGFNV